MAKQIVLNEKNCATKSPFLPLNLFQNNLKHNTVFKHESKRQMTFKTRQ